METTAAIVHNAPFGLTTEKTALYSKPSQTQGGGALFVNVGDYKQSRQVCREVNRPLKSAVWEVASRHAIKETTVERWGYPMAMVGDASDACLSHGGVCRQADFAFNADYLNRWWELTENGVISMSRVPTLSRGRFDKRKVGREMANVVAKRVGQTQTVERVGDVAGGEGGVVQMLDLSTTVPENTGQQQGMSTAVLKLALYRDLNNPLDPAYNEVVITCFVSETLSSYHLLKAKTDLFIRFYDNFRGSVSANVIQHKQARQSKRQIVALPTNGRVPVQGMFIEYVHGQSLYRLIGDMYTRRRRSHEDVARVLCPLIFETAWGLAVGQKDIGFCHNDCHTENLMVSEHDDDEPVDHLVFVGATPQQCWVFTDVRHRPRLIDYGFSRIAVDNGEIVAVGTGRYDNCTWDMAYLLAWIYLHLCSFQWHRERHTGRDAVFVDHLLEETLGRPLMRKIADIDLSQGVKPFHYLLYSTRNANVDERTLPANILTLYETSLLTDDIVSNRDTFIYSFD